MPSYDFISYQDKQAPMLVTGADGYVAGVLVRELLLAGCTVHATIVQPLERVRHLQEIADKCEGSLRFFHADLLEPGSFTKAMKGCRVVIHTASPFMLKRGLDPQRDLIDPAVQGVVNVLKTVNETASVERVVQTSSVGAIYANAIDTYSAPNGILNEEIWNMNSTPEHQPYFLSKTLAERKAWQIAKEQSRWTLVALNPALILGPGVRYHHNSESFKTMQTIAGVGLSNYLVLLTGIPNIATPVVDVRDVAYAHMKAAFCPASVPSGRYIVSAANTNLSEIATWLRQKYPHYTVPGMVSPIPKSIAAVLVGYSGQSVDAMTIRNNMNVKINVDNSKSKEILGLQYRKPSSTVQEMFQQMVDAGAVRPGPRPDLVGLLLLVAIAFALLPWLALTPTVSQLKDELLFLLEEHGSK